MAAFYPGHPRLMLPRKKKTRMPGTADKFTQSAQSRLLRPGMTVAQSAINASLQNALDVNHRSQLEAVSTFIISDFRTGRASATAGMVAHPKSKSEHRRRRQLNVLGAR
jgi:hypothetical protein